MKRCEEMKIVVEITLLREDLYFFLNWSQMGPSSSISLSLCQSQGAFTLDLPWEEGQVSAQI